MKKEEIARFLWDSLPQQAKRLLKFLWNLFPLEIEQLHDFIVEVKESREPVEIEKIDEEAIASDHEYHTYTLIGKRFAVELVSFAANGKKIVHKYFHAFLPANINGQIDKERETVLTQKLSYETRKILQYLKLKEVPVKNSN